MRALIVAAVLVPGVAYANAVRITEIAIEVEPTNARGKPWDRSKDSIAEPDLVIKLGANGHKLTSCDAGDDSVRGFCLLDETIDVVPDTRIELEVYDDDGGVISPGDHIGTGVIHHVAVTEAATLSFELKGRIKSATLTVAPVPSWFDKHKPHFLGFVIGIAGALGLIGGFKTKLLAPDPPPPPMPKCAHCSAELRKRDRRCFNCGAAR
jgi:hypothetical protein